MVDADGNELASGRVESGSTLHWYNDELWIVGAAEVLPHHEVAAGRHVEVLQGPAGRTCLTSGSG